MVMIATASTVASAIAKKPLATHCAAPMASAVLDVPVPVEHEPADQRAHQIGEHRNGEDHPAGPGPDGQRRDHRPGLHEEPEQESRCAPGHHGGDGAEGRAGDDDADPEAALQRPPPARAPRPPGVPPPAGLARPARVRADRPAPRRAPGRPAGPWPRPRGLPRPGRLGFVGLGWHPASRRPVTRAARARAAPVRPGARAPSGASAVPARITSPLARAPRARVPRTGPPGRTRRGRPSRVPAPGGTTPPRPAAAAGGTAAPGARPVALPEHQAAAPERGRAAWLQVRRRTGCSGVFRAIVGRS